MAPSTNNDVRNILDNILAGVDLENSVLEANRKKDNIRFTLNPWWKQKDDCRDGDPEGECFDEECPKKKHPEKKHHHVVHGPVDDKWSDLLLELTLATAYANILGNTPIVDAVSAFSFLAFFGLIWWIWASQVIYNARFRTIDVVHRLIFASLQFLVFGMMAAFTSDFNVFSGLLQSSSEKLTGLANFNMSQPSIDDVLLSSLNRDRLPSLNARGISITMACSRMLLFVQYGVVLYYLKSEPQEYSKYKRSIEIHMGTLLFSCLAYLIAFGVGGFHPTSGGDIAKISLWSAPVVIEIGSYFYIINRVKDRVKIQSEPLHKRSAILFVVILGAGLNQITGSFKYVVGAVGFTAKGGSIMFSAAVIVMAVLFLYSKNNWETWGGENRILLWFFSHYVLMATLILALQCIRTLLSFANLQTSIQTLLNMAVDIYVWLISNHHNIATVEMFPGAATAFADLGINFSDFITEVNNWGNTATSSDLAKALFFVACVTFNEFDAFPQQGSALYDEVKAFFEDSTFDTHMTYKVLGDLFESRLHSALWFWGTAGGILVMLAILSLLKQNPADKYEFLSIALKFMAGSIFMAFSGLTVGRNQPYYANWEASTTDPHVSRPWNAMGASWLIPSFAVVLVFVALIDVALAYCAVQSYPPEATPTPPMRNLDRNNEQTRLLNEPPSNV